MKLILIFVLVISLGVLSLLAESKVPASNVESLRKRSSDASRTYRVASMKRGNWKSSSDRWHKANHSPVCFGARNNQYGRFFVPSSGNLAAIKLVHQYGYVSCHTSVISYWSYWGCGDNTWHGLNVKVNVVITTSGNRVLLPPNEFVTHSAKWAKIPGYNSLSPELVLSVVSHTQRVTSGQELRLWYGEDLLYFTENDNGGRVCCDVYALIV